jgi:hypothetical protein
MELIKEAWVIAAIIEFKDSLLETQNESERNQRERDARRGIPANKIT